MMALDLVITELVRKTVVVLSVHLGLESFLVLSADPDNERVKNLERYITNIILTLEIPSPKSLVEGGQAIGVTVAHSYLIPLALPASLYLMNRLMKIWDSLQQDQLSPEEKLARFETLISASTLSPAVKLINADPDFLRRFKADFLGHFFGLYMPRPSLKKAEFQVATRWTDLIIGGGKLTSLFGLLQTHYRRELGFLMWMNAGIRDLPDDVIPEPKFLDSCVRPEQLPMQSFNFLTDVIDNLMKSLAKPAPDNNGDSHQDLVQQTEILLVGTMKKCRSFSRLWLQALMGSSKSDSLLHRQFVLLSQSLLYLFIVESRADMNAFDWEGFLEARNEVEARFAPSVSNLKGVEGLVHILSYFADTFFAHAMDENQYSLFLYSILDYYILSDLALASADPRQYDFDGVLSRAPFFCLLPTTTMKADLSIFLELLDENGDVKLKSDPNKKLSEIWTHMPPFVACHKILEILQSPTPQLGADLEVCLQNRLSKQREQCNRFRVPQFAEPGAPIARSFIYSVFLAYQTHYSSLKTYDLCTFYSEKEGVSGSGLSRLQHAAVTFCLLQRGAAFVSEGENLGEQLDKWNDQRLSNFVPKILKPSKDMQLFFVQTIKPQERMIEFVASERALQLFKLHPDFTPREELKGAMYYLFPFVVDKNTEDGSIYFELEKLVKVGNVAELRNWIANHARSTPIGYLRVRFFLANIAYYSFYNHSKKCDAIWEALQAPEIITQLKIADGDRKAYQILTSGGVSGVENDDLLWFFCNDDPKRPKNYDMTPRHLMANVLIFTLGCPPSSNHFYTRIFTPELLSSGVRGPGSTFSNEQDCGYYLSDNGELEVRDNRYANIFGGSRLYRLTFNMLTWSAICLALLVDPGRNVRPIGNVCFHGSYRQHDEVLRLKAYLTDEQALKQYVMQRPNMYLHYLELESNLLELNIQAPLFVAQVLYRVWTDLVSSIGTPQGAVYKGTYASDTETLSYENRIKERAFDGVMKDHAILRQPYEDFLNNDVLLAQIIRRRDLLTEFNRRSLRILSHDTFVQKASALEVGSHPNLQKFKEHKRFRGIKHLPLLVRFYHWIHDELGFIVSRDEVMGITLRECVSRIASNDGRLSGERLLVDMKGRWNEVLSNHPNYQVCKVARANNEDSIPQFTDDFKLATVISFGEDAVEFDHLFRLIKDICDQQGRLTSEGEPYQVASLPENPDLFSILLNIGNAEEPLAWVKDFALFDDDGEITFDWDAIERKLEIKYLKGLVGLSVDTLKKPFHFKVEGEREALSGLARKPGEENEAADVTPLSSTVLLATLLNKLPPAQSRDILEDERTLAEEEKRWAASVKWTEADFNQIAAVLSSVCRYISSPEGAEKAQKSTSLLDFVSDTNGAIQVTTKFEEVLRRLKVPLAFLKGLCAYTVRSFHEKQFLFSDLEKALSTEPLPQSVKEKLFSTALRVRDLTSLQQIADTVLAPEIRKVIVLTPQWPIRKSVDVRLAKIGLSPEILDSCLPLAIMGKHCADYLRALYKTCGTIQYLQLSATRSAGAQQYTELVPKDCEAMQLKLKDSAPFEPPPVKEDPSHPEPETEKVDVTAAPTLMKDFTDVLQTPTTEKGYLMFDPTAIKSYQYGGSKPFHPELDHLSKSEFVFVQAAEVEQPQEEEEEVPPTQPTQATTSQAPEAETIAQPNKPPGGAQLTSQPQAVIKPQSQPPPQTQAPPQAITQAMLPKAESPQPAFPSSSTGTSWKSGALKMIQALKTSKKLSEEDAKRFQKMVMAGNEDMKTFYETFPDSLDDFFDNITNYSWS